MSRRFVPVLLAVALITSFAPGIASAQGEATYRGVLPVVKHDVSPPLRLMVPAAEPGSNWKNLLADPGEEGPQTPGTDTFDPAIQDWVGYKEIPSPAASFNGPGNTCGGCAPPDPNGDVGPNHVVTMQNAHFAVYSKTGTLLLGPLPNNTLWAGFGGACQNENAGDPVVLYDQLDDRWFLTQFTAAGPTYFVCVALSQTGDPTGAYDRWAVSTGTSFPDYPKMGIWPDAYYISTREFPTSGAERPGAYAMDRAAMLAGNPSPTIISFVVTPGSVPAYAYGNGLLPSDLDGFVPPPPGAPNYYIGSMDDGGPLGAPQDALSVWEFHADFVTPGNSTFTFANTVPIDPYDTIFPCTPSSRTCIPQPATSNKLDILSYRQRPLHRAAYRNFGTHESIVTNQSVEAGSGSGIAGIRWWELRNPGGSPTIFQEGTYAPGLTDGIHRWMASVAMDSSGNIAMGYSASDDNSPAGGTFPSVWYTGRLASDPLGTMPQGEGSFINGTGSQTGGGSRWGDYTSTTIDPTDDCTFWHVNEWVPTTSSSGYQLRVGAFRFPFPECGSPDFTISPDPLVLAVCQPDNAVYTINVGSISGFTGDVTLGASGNPAGTSVGFSTNPVTAPGSSTMTISNTVAATPGSYTVTVTGTSAGPGPHSADVGLDIVAAPPAAPTLTSPPNGSSGVSTSPTLEWGGVAGAVEYFVEVDDDAGFGSPEFTATVSGTSVVASGLAPDTLYNWRVSSINVCGTGTPSAAFTFSTGVLFCSTGAISIPSSGTATPYPSEVTVTAPGTQLAAVTVEITGFSHTYPDDLDLLLVGPGGENLIVMSDAGGSNDLSNASLTFDDAAASPLPDSTVIADGSYRPTNYGTGDNFPGVAGPYGNPEPAGTDTFTSVFGGTDPNGTWGLYVVDDVGGDSGSIAGWCLVPVFADPQIAVDPTSIANTQGADEVVTVPLDIDNVGTGSLDWTIEEEPVPIAPKSYRTRPMNAAAGPGDARVAVDDAWDDDGWQRGPAPDRDAPVWDVPEVVLYDNGPLVTHPGGGSGGADASAVQTALGMSLYGFGNQVSAGNRMADDFTVADAAGWNVDTITFFGYQTNSTTTSTITAVNFRIWDGPPNDPGSTVVFGDTTTNRLLSTTWSNIYRVLDTGLTATNRPVMAIVASVGTSLPAGTYWVDWQVGGTAALSGPWAPPISILGQPATGNALQFTGSWGPALDTGSGAQQGMPFVVEGTLALCGSPSDVPWLAVSPTSGSTAGGGTTTVDVELDSTGLTQGSDYFATLCIASNDADDPLVAVPVQLTVDFMPFLDGFETGDTSRWSYTTP